MMETEQILEFIDGSLDADAEQTLFDAMARQPELRTALRQYIAIGEGVRSDREAFVPPVFLEHALLSGLGIGVVASEVVGGASWLARLGAIGSKLWPLVAAFTAGAIISGGGTYMATRGTERDATSTSRVQYAQPANPSQSSPSPQAQPPVVAQTPMAAPQQTAPPSIAAESPSRLSSSNSSSSVIASSRRRSTQRSLVSESVVAEQESETLTPTPTDNAPMQKADVIVRTSLMPAPHVDMEITPEQPDLTSPRGTVPVPVIQAAESAPWKPSLITLEGRTQGFGLQGQVISNNAEYATGSLLESDVAFGAYLAPSRAWQIGLEGGIERYAQTLRVYNGDTSVVEQMPKYNWVGATARYNIGQNPLLGFAYPYTQVTAGLAFSSIGGTLSGPVVHGRLGANVPINISGLSLNLTAAFETSSFIYTFRGQPLLAGRYGFTGGLEIGLPF